MRILSRYWAIGLLGFLFIAVMGCATTSGKDALPKTDALLEPSNSLKFNDIPVPTGFKFLPKDSYTFENSGIRVGVLKYQGKADMEQVINFYKNQMLIFNWNLLNIIEYGEGLLNFEREQETCVINLSPKGNHIIITASLGPKSTQLKNLDKPIK